MSYLNGYLREFRRLATHNDVLHVLVHLEEDWWKGKQGSPVAGGKLVEDCCAYMRDVEKRQRLDSKNKEFVLWIASGDDGDKGEKDLYLLKYYNWSFKKGQYKQIRADGAIPFNLKEEQIPRYKEVILSGGNLTACLAFSLVYICESYEAPPRFNIPLHLTFQGNDNRFADVFNRKTKKCLKGYTQTIFDHPFCSPWKLGGKYELMYALNNEGLGLIRDENLPPEKIKDLQTVYINFMHYT